MSVSESLILWPRWRIRLSRALLARQITERECAEVLVRWTLAEENTVHQVGNIRRSQGSEVRDAMQSNLGLPELDGIRVHDVDEIPF